MTALVTGNLPLVSSAPNGISKLRELILALAVGGKLVAQDPSEECAQALLEETKLSRSSLSKRPKSLAISDADIELPAGWARSPLANLALKLTDGSHNPPPDAGVGFPMLSSQNVRDGLVDFSSPSRFIAPEGFEKEDARTRATPGDVLLTIVASIGRSAVVPRGAPPFALQRSVAVIQTLLVPEYLCLFLRSPGAVAYYWRHAAGTAQKGIYLGKLGELSVAVPPLAEQHRIVAKVDELMALCDRLEAEQADAEAAHAKLVEALLASLTQARDAADFRASWQQLAEHFHTLFTTEASVDALKQAVMQVGVMGRLTRQLADEEPAIALLDRATHARQLEAKPSRSSRSALPSEISDAEKLFALPSGWAWTRKSNVLRFLNGYAFKSEWFKPQGTRLLRNVNIGHGSLDWKECAAISPDQAAVFGEFELRAEDLVLTLDRPIISTGLKVAIVKDDDLPCLLLQRVAKICAFADCIATDYLFIWLNSPFFINGIDPGRSNGVPHISTAQIAKMVFALPPLAEQHRIVAKVNELLALCDQLRRGLTTARQSHERLATVLVENAVNPGHYKNDDSSCCAVSA